MIEKDNIYCIDALEGLKQLPDKSVDLILTDPPYEVNYLERWYKHYQKIKRHIHKRIR